ncbi:MAG: AAA family ATPase [Coriobacteriia bacterium]|nr:AAA family ATPase [Coriobacteriia bacterium]
MKLAFAGKGGVGKTTIAAWMADYLVRAGHNVWLVDADTALSLGVASGLKPEELPVALVQRKDLFGPYVGSGIIKLDPDVSDLSGSLAVTLPESDGLLVEGATQRGSKKLLVMGSIASAGGGCACEANALLKAMLAHLIYDEDGYVLVDLEAGVEHLGRGTVAHVDHLVVVSEPSLRSLETAQTISMLAEELGLADQILVMNRFDQDEIILPETLALPEKRYRFGNLAGLQERMLADGSVLDLPEREEIDVQLGCILADLR